MLYQQNYVKSGCAIAGLHCISIIENCKSNEANYRICLPTGHRSSVAPISPASKLRQSKSEKKLTFSALSITFCFEQMRARISITIRGSVRLYVPPLTIKENPKIGDSSLENQRGHLLGGFALSTFTQGKKSIFPVNAKPTNENSRYNTKILIYDNRKRGKFEK